MSDKYTANSSRSRLQFEANWRPLPQSLRRHQKMACEPWENDAMHRSPTSSLAITGLFAVAVFRPIGGEEYYSDAPMEGRQPVRELGFK